MLDTSLTDGNHGAGIPAGQPTPSTRHDSGMSHIPKDADTA
jgi:hypothetical protein